MNHRIQSKLDALKACVDATANVLERDGTAIRKEIADILRTDLANLVEEINNVSTNKN